jgi:putative nucleotidyltransferase with HDIG domain
VLCFIRAYLNKTLEVDNLFLEIDFHLLKDKNPSKYLESISETKNFKAVPFDMLYRLKQTEQPFSYHPEGNVWNHTMLVVEEAAQVKTKCFNPRAFMWAALLHDIGKPYTTIVHKGEIIAYDHDKAGAKLARKLLENFSEDQDFINFVVALVRWHMHVLFVAKNASFADIESMKSEIDIKEVALFGSCDRFGRLNVDKDNERKIVELFLKKCKQKT